MLTAALIGLPQSGKTTFFQVLTDKSPGRGGELARAVVPVADPRLARLEGAFHPRKVTPAQIAFIDVPGFGEGQAKRFLADIRDTDLLVEVVAAFPGSSPDPDTAAETIGLELTVADLDSVERRLQRLSKGRLAPGEDVEKAALEKLAPHLSEGRPIRQAGLAKEELASLRSLALLTVKPLIFVLNAGEDGRPPVDANEFGRRHAGAVLTASAEMEREIAELEAAERDEFLQSMGFEESGVDRLTRTAYRHLGLISFLTAGEDEVRAWTVTDGTSAREAAGKIHSDIERGFIRAEVVAYDDFVASGLSMQTAKESGLWRLEGKEYVVQDGDIINFRFNA